MHFQGARKTAIVFVETQFVFLRHRAHTEVTLGLCS